MQKCNNTIILQHASLELIKFIFAVISKETEFETWIQTEKPDTWYTWLVFKMQHLCRYDKDKRGWYYLNLYNIIDRHLSKMSKNLFLIIVYLSIITRLEKLKGL